MKDIKLKKLTLSAILIAIAVVGSMFSFPIFGSKCAPIQHIVNIVSAVTLGPIYALGVAFSSSLIRNLLGLGTLLAFPGSIFGAFLSALIYKKTKNLNFSILGEVFGTSILGGPSAYPIAIKFLGIPNSKISFYSFIIPFFISTFVGSIVSDIVISYLKKTNILNNFN